MTLLGPELAIPSMELPEKENTQKQAGDKSNYPNVPTPVEVVHSLREEDDYQADLISELVSELMIDEERSIFDPKVEAEFRRLHGALALSRIALHRPEGVTGVEEAAAEKSAHAMTEAWGKIGGRALMRTLEGTIDILPPLPQKEKTPKDQPAGVESRVDDEEGPKATVPASPENGQEPPTISGPIRLGKKVLSILRDMEDRLLWEGNYQREAVEEPIY